MANDEHEARRRAEMERGAQVVANKALEQMFAPDAQVESHPYVKDQEAWRKQQEEVRDRQGWWKRTFDVSDG